MWAWCFVRDSNVYIKTAMLWFQFPQIQELMSPNVASFIWQCYSSSVHSVLFIILEIVLFACLIKEWSFWWIFSCLFSLIGGLEEERSLTIFNRCQINTYIRANIFQKSKRCRFAVKLDQTTTNLWTFSALTPFNFLQLSLRVIP